MMAVPLPTRPVDPSTLLAAPVKRLVLLFLFHCAIKLMYIILVLSSHELQRSGASGIEGGRTDSVYPDKRYSRPANVSTTSSF